MMENKYRAKYTNNKARRKYIIVSFFIEQARLKKWVATLILSIILSII